jgi:hypothetical protein
MTVPIVPPIAADWLPKPPPEGAPKPPEGALLPEDKATVRALFEAILPGRPDAPGATDADAVSYLDSLPETVAAPYASLIPLLRKAGADTEPARVLRDLAAGTLPDWPEEAMPQRRFFTVLRDHCIEGCFADPRWGGNKDSVMWRWFGYPQPPAPFRRDGVQ